MPSVHLSSVRGQAIKNALRVIFITLSVIAIFSIEGWVLVLYWMLFATFFSLTARDISHPDFYFVLVFSLYGLSYYVLQEAGVIPRQEVHLFVARVHFLALSCFMIGATGKSAKIRKLPAKMYVKYAFPTSVLLIPLLLLALFHIYAALSTGDFTSKSDIVDSRSTAIGLRLGPIYVPITLLLGMLYLRGLLVESARTWIPIFLALALGLALLSVAGERDVLLRFVIVFAFIWNAVRARINVGLALSGFLALLLAMPVLQAFKGFVLSTVNVYEFSLYSILGGEFKASARAFADILNNWRGFMLGETFWWDAKRVVLPSVFSGEVKSTTGWFNYELLAIQGSGRGFSLVGEMYLNFGLPAVILGFVLMGRIVKAMYIRQSNGVFWLLGYSVFATVLLYSIRGDLATLIGSPLKLIVLPILLIIIMLRILGPQTSSLESSGCHGR